MHFCRSLSYECISLLISMYYMLHERVAVLYLLIMLLVV